MTENNSPPIDILKDLLEMQAMIAEIDEENNRKEALKRSRLTAEDINEMEKSLMGDSGLRKLYLKGKDDD